MLIVSEALVVKTLITKFKMLCCLLFLNKQSLKIYWLKTWNCKQTRVCIITVY